MKLVFPMADIEPLHDLKTSSRTPFSRITIHFTPPMAKNPLDKNQAKDKVSKKKAGKSKNRKK